MRPSLLLRFLRVYCTIGLWFYFRKWQVSGRENVPTTGPLIYIANHQNAFIDAILMACSASRTPFFIARAGVFSKPWAAKLLAKIHIKPIYRFRDGYSTLKNNDVVMQDCVDLMKRNEVILLFPEGNHNEPWSMRTFQKGFARLANMHHQQTNGAPLHIVPIGIHYTEHHGFNARVLINFGKPISVQDYMVASRSERENLDALVTVSEQAVKALALDLKPEEEYTLRQQHLVNNREFQPDMVAQLEADRRIAGRYPSSSPSNNNDGTVRKIFAPIIGVLVFATHGLLYWWVKNLIKKKIKDPQFISSVKYALGIFITPVYYLLLLVISIAISGSASIGLAFLIILPVVLILYTKMLRVTQ